VTAEGDTGDRAAPAPRPPLRRRLRRLITATAAKTYRDSIGVEASALAFATVLGFIPLLASVLWVGEHIFNEYRQNILDALGRFLPYSEETLLLQIEGFLDQAQAIRGLGLVGFAAVALLTFANIEETLNRIWGVTSNRSLRLRVWSLLLLLFFGPILIGAAYSTLAMLRTGIDFERLFQQSALLRMVPFGVTFIGLTMLYWSVPHTRVRFRAAVTGGLVSALLLEILRIGFAAYLGRFHTMSVVYGGFALALFFMISIQIAWFLVLLGCEISYAVQHYGWLSVPTPPIGLDAAWQGVVALLLLQRRQEGTHAGEYTPREALADDLEVTAEEARRALEPLVRAGWVEKRGRGHAGYHLRADLEGLSLDKVLAAYDTPDEQLERPLPKFAGERLQTLRTALRARHGDLLKIKLADLLDDPRQAAALSEAHTAE
jgi:membrane protein